MWLLLTRPCVQAPVALDIRSPLDLVYECFAKLGLRYVCVLKRGEFAGVVSLVTTALLFCAARCRTDVCDSQIHKKTFAKYVRELEERG
jgi:chloride channel 3/4/5